MSDVNLRRAKLVIKKLWPFYRDAKKNFKFAFKQGYRLWASDNEKMYDFKDYIGGDKMQIKLLEYQCPKCGKEFTRLQKNKWIVMDGSECKCIATPRIICVRNFIEECDIAYSFKKMIKELTKDS